MFLKKSSVDKRINFLTLNPYGEGENYLFKNDLFQPVDRLSYDNANFVISYINNKDIMIATVDISRNVPLEDIHGVLDIKVYEELGLDPTNTYVTASLEVESSSEERKFHIFVVETSYLDALFLSVKKQTKYLDLIIPAPLLFKPLYQKEILNDTKAHAFVYFTKQDTFITVYSEGQYLYSKSIEFTLEYMYEKYCEEIGEKVDESEFYALFESEGLKTTNTNYQHYFSKIFTEIFIMVNDIILYVKRAFEIDAIDQIYIGSQRGAILGLSEYSQNYLGIESLDLNLDYHISNKEWYIDQLHYLMLLSGFGYSEDEAYLANLSIYPRPPSFLMRSSGQFIISMVGAVSLSLAYPMFELIGTYVNDSAIFILNQENNALTKEANSYKKILGDKKQQMKILDDEIKVLSDKYHAKMETLSAIYDKKVNYRLKSGMLHRFSEDLDKFDVHVEMLRTENNTLWLALLSSDDRKFTEVIKYISDTHFDEMVSINIEKIEKDDASEYYKGLLKVELK